MANQSNNNLFGKMGKNELDNLQKAIDLLIKYNNMQKQVTSTSSKDTQRVIDLRLRYAEQLKKLNVDLNTDVKELQARYKETERQLKAQSEDEDRINKQRLKQQREINKERERSKLISQLERDFQLEISLLFVCPNERRVLINPSLSLNTGIIISNIFILRIIKIIYLLPIKNHPVSIAT